MLELSPSVLRSVHSEAIVSQSTTLTSWMIKVKTATRTPPSTQVRHSSPGPSLWGNTVVLLLTVRLLTMPHTIPLISAQPVMMRPLQIHWLCLTLLVVTRTLLLVRRMTSLPRIWGPSRLVCHTVRITMDAWVRHSQVQS